HHRLRLERDERKSLMSACRLPLPVEVATEDLRLCISAGVIWAEGTRCAENDGLRSSEFERRRKTRHVEHVAASAHRSLERFATMNFRRLVAAETGGGSTRAVHD